VLKRFLHTGRSTPLALSLAAAFFGFSAPASAQQQTPEMGAPQSAPEMGVPQQQITETDAAGLLVEAGQLDLAKRVLAHVLETTPDDLQAHFLRGLVAVAENRYDDAIEDFRFVLAAEPDRERVRLELGRAFFLAADYENAERNFRFARAGDLPDEAKRNIDQYLATIDRLKRWSYNLGLSVAQDTNVNGATSVHQIDIYGLPSHYPTMRARRVAPASPSMWAANGLPFCSATPRVGLADKFIASNMAARLSTT
jgi:tetratricopeptide (TPR) repeat protein